MIVDKVKELNTCLSNSHYFLGKEECWELHWNEEKRGKNKERETCAFEAKTARGFYVYLEGVHQGMIIRNLDTLKDMI